MLKDKEKENRYHYPRKHVVCFSPYLVEKIVKSFRELQMMSLECVCAKKKDISISMLKPDLTLGILKRGKRDCGKHGKD